MARLKSSSERRPEERDAPSPERKLCERQKEVLRQEEEPASAGPEDMIVAAAAVKIMRLSIMHELYIYKFKLFSVHL